MDNSNEVRVLGPSFPKPPKLTKYPKTCITQSLISFTLEQHFIVSEMWSWTLLITFFVFVGPNFLDLPQFHKNTKIGINQLSDDLHTWAGLHVIWNVQCNNMDDVLCICALNLGFQGTIYMIGLIPKHTKTSETRLLDGLYTWVRCHLMWNLEFNTLDDFLYIHAHEFEYFNPISLICPNFPNTLKQV